MPTAASPDDVVFASMTVNVPWTETVLGLAFKPTTEQMIQFDGGPAQRLVAANAAGPLLMRLPPSAPAGPGAGDRLSVSSFQLSGTTGPTNVTFYEMPYRLA